VDVGPHLQLILQAALDELQMRDERRGVQVLGGSRRRNACRLRRESASERIRRDVANPSQASRAGMPTTSSMARRRREPSTAYRPRTLWQALLLTARTRLFPCPPPGTASQQPSPLSRALPPLAGIFPAQFGFVLRIIAEHGAVNDLVE
jgi:hypothetical protein